MVATTVYLVRHAEAAGHDDADPGLTHAGRLQAATVAEALAGRGIDAVLHGARRRTSQTAAIIAEVLGVPARHSDTCEDRTPVPDDWSLVPEAYHPYLRSVPADEADVGGHQLDEALAVLSTVGTADRSIVAVTHNFVIGWFVRSVLDAPWAPWVGLDSTHCGVTAIRWQAGRSPHIACFNDHLGRAVRPVSDLG